MKIEFHPNFKKSYKNRIKNNPALVGKTTQKVELFRKDPTNPLLKDHKLIGSKNKYRAFSISGDIRIIYLLISKNQALFLDIGSHNQVY